MSGVSGGPLVLLLSLLVIAAINRKINCRSEGAPEQHIFFPGGVTEWGSDAGPCFGRRRQTAPLLKTRESPGLGGSAAKELGHSQFSVVQFRKY